MKTMSKIEGCGCNEAASQNKIKMSTSGVSIMSSMDKMPPCGTETAGPTSAYEKPGYWLCSYVDRFIDTDAGSVPIIKPKLQTEDLFVDTESPTAGDIVCWDGHVGIVYDEQNGKFIGAQTSTGVFVASYTSGYWATTKTVNKFRKWNLI